MQPTLLTVELVPAPQWGDNLRSHLSKAQWDKLRKEVYKKANYRCEICGGKGNRWPVECHEIWHYDEEKKQQVLVGMIALCPKCHEVKHIGRSMSTGKGERATRHLMKVNQWSYSDAQYYIEAVFEQWHRRNRFDWTIDISWLNSID